MKKVTIIGFFPSKPERLNTDETMHLNERIRKKKNMNKNNNAVRFKDIRAMLLFLTLLIYFDIL